MLLIIFGLICAGLLAWGCLARGRIYEFPFLAGTTFFSFVLPQLIGLRNDTELPDGAFAKTLLMVILCAAMCYLGYIWRSRPFQTFTWELDENRILWVSAVLSLIGALFFFGITRLPEELTSSTQWSGAPVAYLFFAQVLTYGLTLAALLYFRTKSWLALLIVALDSLLFLNQILVAGRRGIALLFGFILLLSVWFGRQQTLPRPLMLAGILWGTLFLYSTGDYRSITLDEDGPQWKQVRRIPFLTNLRTLMAEGGAELRNVVFTLEAVESTRAFDFGLFHWNKLVFNYVPAQIFGEDFKESLTVPLANDNVAEAVLSYRPETGSTETGFADAFGSFWYFGCFKFFIIAFVMSKVYRAAMVGNLMAQTLYILLLVPALHSITHHTHWFISPWIHMAIFLLPALYMARARRPLVGARMAPWRREPPPCTVQIHSP